MGMRQNIKLTYSPEITDTKHNGQINTFVDAAKSIFIFSHWDGGEKGNSTLEDSLRRALAKHWRWDDESYLTRIIIDEVIGKEQGKETGYGISPLVGEEEYPTIEVDFAARTVDGVSFEDFIT